MNIIKVRYSIEPRDRIYVEGYEFLSFAKNMGKNLSNNYGKKRIDTAKKSTSDIIKQHQKELYKKAQNQLAI